MIRQKELVAKFLGGTITLEEQVELATAVIDFKPSAITPPPGFVNEFVNEVAPMPAGLLMVSEAYAAVEAAVSEAPAVAEEFPVPGAVEYSKDPDPRGKLGNVPAIGDILISSWGYEQTNISWFKVVGTTPKGVKLRKLNGK